MFLTTIDYIKVLVTYSDRFSIRFRILCTYGHCRRVGWVLRKLRVKQARWHPHIFCDWKRCQFPYFGFLLRNCFTPESVCRSWVSSSLNSCSWFPWSKQPLCIPSSLPPAPASAGPASHLVQLRLVGGCARIRPVGKGIGGREGGEIPFFWHLDWDSGHKDGRRRWERTIHNP